MKASPRTETNAHDVVASYPGSRAGAAFWADHSGEGWIFGGIGFSQYDSEHAHILQDLWSFSVLRNEWTLINAGSTGAVSSQGERHPGPRHNAAACVPPKKLSFRFRISLSDMTNYKSADF